MSAGVVVATVLGGAGVGAFIVYAAQAAVARDWRAVGAYAAVLVTLLAVGFVALHFNA